MPRGKKLSEEKKGQVKTHFKDEKSKRWIEREIGRSPNAVCNGGVRRRIRPRWGGAVSVAVRVRSGYGDNGPNVAMHVFDHHSLHHQLM
ncbi:hypothetical protein GN958_ATG13149 [Phytophthora infestans]|uniref:Uncharacterized protein n=1 Tax=Phytophthora infestans TaxID=4787 RepID=A0A8S9UDQ9_PHYIN|nr:hypothetical protein GN958_ATG13149 [Phytophthora infestans]